MKRQDNFAEEEKNRVAGLPMFNGKMNGVFMGKPRTHCFKNRKENLHAGVYDASMEYFEEHKIKWWTGRGEVGPYPTCNAMSSQIACINYLFPFIQDKTCCLSILKNIDSNFTEVLPVSTFKGNDAFIDFEVVGINAHINEGTKTRGANCTSIDAFMRGIRDGKVCIVPIEWKYIEKYGNENKAEGDSGKTRKKRYTELIMADDSPINQEIQQLNLYYEPFYQLMRQTLLVNEMVRLKDYDAEEYLHVHVIPNGNRQLLSKKYDWTDTLGLEQTWKSYLSEPERYKVLSPNDLIGSIGERKYSDTLDYIRNRYPH